MTTTYKPEDYIYASLALVGFVSTTGFMLKFVGLGGGAEEAYDMVEEEWKKLNR